MTKAKASATPTRPVAPPVRSSTMIAPVPIRTRKNVPIASAVALRPRCPGLSAIVSSFARRSARFEKPRQIVGKIALADRARGPLHVVRHSHELDLGSLVAQRHQ